MQMTAIMTGAVLAGSAGGAVRASTGYVGEIVVETNTRYVSTTQTVAATTTITASTTCQVRYTLAGSQSRVTVTYQSHYERKEVRASNWTREIENFSGTIKASHDPGVVITGPTAIGRPYYVTYKPFQGSMQGTDTISAPGVLRTVPIGTGVYCRDYSTVSGTGRSGANSEVYDDQVKESGHFGRRSEELGTKVVRWQIAGPVVVP